MSENKVNNLLGVSMDKIKEMVDVNTVIGDPPCWKRKQTLTIQLYVPITSSLSWSRLQ